MINISIIKLITEKTFTAILITISLIGCVFFTGCSTSNTPGETDTPPKATDVPDKDYTFIFPVTEIDGKYYEFPESDKIGVITANDEQTVFPFLTEIGSTTRTDTPSEYPVNNLQSNCLPDGTRIVYNEQEDKFGLIDGRKEGYWSYSGVYKIYDKSEMKIGKDRLSFEYTDHVRYSCGWIIEEYKDMTKELGFIESLSNEGLMVKSAEKVDRTVVCSGEISHYDCFHPDLYNLDEDLKHYTKRHAFTTEDVDMNTLYHFYVKDGKVVAVVEDKDDKNLDSTLYLGGEIQGLMRGTGIYPAVMVDGHFYKWRYLHGRPKDSIYYGEIVHVDGKTPTKDCEFVSAFPVSGQIYIVPGNSERVYVYLTTEWMENQNVVFDLVEEGDTIHY